MTPREFTYWLQGYFELLDPMNTGKEPLPLSPVQAVCIRRHLGYVFKHIEQETPPKTATIPYPVYPVTGTSILNGGGGRQFTPTTDPDGHWVTTAVC